MLEYFPMNKQPKPNGISHFDIQPSNRGLAFGDGLYESMRCIDREIPLYGHHKERLLASLKRLHIALDEAGLEAELNGVLAQLPRQGSSVVKLIVTRGDSPRGYRADPQAPAWKLWQVFAAPACYGDALTLGLCATRLAEQPLLAGMKHLNRLEQVLARLQWDDEYDDALMLNFQDQVVETVSANVLLLKGDRLLTPQLSGSGVSGVMRTYLRDRVLPLAGLKIEEASITLADVERADGLWLCNSVRGLGQVSRWQDCTWAPSKRFAQVRDHLYQSLHPRWDS